MAKNIAFFLPHFGGGGAESVVLKVIQGIDRSRFQPMLFLQKSHGELLEKLPTDIEVSTLSKPRAPGCIPALAQLCDQRNIALLVTVTNAANLYALTSAVLPKSRFATLVMEHTPPATFLAEAKYQVLRRAAMRLLYPRATLTGGPLEQIGEDLADLLGPKAPPFIRLPNPVIEKTVPLKPIADVARHIVSVGRLAPEKRFDLLIEAFALFHQDRPDVRLTIYGEGPERKTLEAQIVGAGLQDVVTLPGFINDMDKAHAITDVFVCTSRREGLGNAIIEAMARGVPVLSVDCPFGPRRLLQGGDAGCLLLQDDAASIADALAALTADKARREGYVTKAMQGINEFDVEHSVRCYEEAFETALEAARDAQVRP